MAPEVHCSVCDAQVQPGNPFCPGCGLQLTAQAVPAVHIEGPRFSFWPVIIAAIGALWLLCYALDAIKK